jgi:hypothetical protein
VQRVAIPTEITYEEKVAVHKDQNACCRQLAAGRRSGDRQALR